MANTNQRIMGSAAALALFFAAPLINAPRALAMEQHDAKARLRVMTSAPNAEVFIDGGSAGPAPFERDDLEPGKHYVVVRAQGFADWKRAVDLDPTAPMTLSAEPVASGMATARRVRGMASFSAATVEPKHFTADISGGFVPFGQVRLTAGAVRTDWIGFDVGVEMRTIGYFNEGLAHAKLQFVQAGPLAVAFDLSVGGGGGPAARNDFIFEAGLPLSLLFGNLVRFTAHPYLQVYSDQNCPTRDALANDPGLAEHEQSTCSATRDANGKWNAIWQGTPYALSQGPRLRFVGARLILQAALEIAVAEHVNIFAIFEGDPIGRRQALTAKFSSLFPTTDPQMYGRLGLGFKF